MHMPVDAYSLLYLGMDPEVPVDQDHSAPRTDIDNKCEIYRDENGERIDQTDW